MAGKSSNYGKATKPVDVSAVDQESETQKPSEEQVPTSQGLASQGYKIPPSFRALEEAGGDLEKAAQIVREQSGGKTQAEINAEADESMGLGKKKGTAPAENKSAKK